MSDTESLRRIARAMIERPEDEDAIQSAAEILRLAAEIDNQMSGARKLSAEERKLLTEAGESDVRRKSDDRKAYITLLAPVFTTLVLAGTLVMQGVQFRQSEKDKADEAERQSALNEDQQWSQTLDELSKSEGVSAGGVSLQKFAKSMRYADLARKTAIQILIKTRDQDVFEEVFGSVFGAVDRGNFQEIAELDRNVDAKYIFLSQKEGYDLKNNRPTKRTLSKEDRDELSVVSYKLQSITAKIEPTIKGRGPGPPFDLHSVDLWDADLHNSSLKNANISSADFTFIDLTGADLSGIVEFQDSSFAATAWWRALKIDKLLLDYLKQKKFAFDPKISYKEVRQTAWNPMLGTPNPLTAEGYKDSVSRLEGAASSP